MEARTRCSRFPVANATDEESVKIPNVSVRAQPVAASMEPCRVRVAAGAVPGPGLESSLYHAAGTARELGEPAARHAKATCGIPPAPNAMAREDLPAPLAMAQVGSRWRLYPFTITYSILELGPRMSGALDRLRQASKSNGQ